MALQPTVMIPRLRDRTIIVVNVMTVNKIAETSTPHWTVHVPRKFS